MNHRRVGRRIAVALVALALVGGLAGTVALRAAKREGQKDARAVALQFVAADVVHVESRPLDRWLPVSGTLQAVRQAVVKAKVAGDIEALRVREGEPVKAGDVLARVRSPDLEARLVDRQGAVESARAQLALAEKTRAMNLRLLAGNFISQNAFDATESTYNVARGNLKSAEAQVQVARNALADAAVVAPLAGIVAKRHVQTGEKVAVESPILTIVDLADLEVQALVPAQDVPALALGMPVDLAVDGFGARRFAGRIERINPETEPGTRAIIVYVALPNPDAALRSGMFATGRVALAASPPLPTLPLAALRSEAGQAYVWTIEQGRLAKRVVMTGRRDETSGLVEIRTPLSPDTPVLAARFDNLKDGAPAFVQATSSQNAARAKGRGDG